MQVAAYEALINKLQGQADQAPWFFRFRVSLYIALGYLMMAFVLVGLILLLGLLAAGRLLGRAIGLIIFTFVLVRGLMRGIWPKFPPSEGVQLKRADAPPLFDMIDELRRELHAPRIHRIYLYNGFNAMASQRPILRMFRFHRNEVTLGAPLLSVLSLEEVRAILAHEIGHIRHRHSRFSLKVAKISGAWTAAMDDLATMDMKAYIIGPMVNAYTPWLSAASFVLSRIDEREANASARAVCGAEALAKVFVNFAVLSPSAEKTLQSLSFEILDAETIPNDIFLRQLNRLTEPIPAETMLENLKQGLSMPYDPYATHPPLSQQLRELDVDPELDHLLKVAPLPDLSRECAGTTLFGAGFQDFLRRASAKYAQASKKVWTQQRAAYVLAQQEAEKLLKVAREIPPTEKERVELALSLYKLDRNDEARKWIEPIRDRDGESRFVYGLILKDQDNPEWLGWMEKASETLEIQPAAYQVLVAHYNSQGNRPQVQRLLEALQDIEKSAGEAAEHQNEFGPFWAYYPASWSPEEQSEVIRAVSVVDASSKAYLVDRASRDGRHRGACLVVLYAGKMFVDPSSMAQKIIAGIHVEKAIMVFVMKKAPAVFNEIPGSLIWERGV